jgi:hypothetical protein
VYRDDFGDYEDEECELAEIPDLIDEDEEEDALWDDEAEMEEADAAEDAPSEENDAFSDIDQTAKAQRQIASEAMLIEELEADAEENPIEDDDGNSKDEGEEKRKKLKRELQAEALARLEDAARTQADFKAVIDWWDRLDRNRERKERYHELSRSGDDVPLDYGASADDFFFPDTLSDVIQKQIRKGDFLDAIFYCPYDIHELVTEEYLSKILWELKEEHKELLFLCAVCLFSSTKIGFIRGQTDRNIRKIRKTMLKQIRKKLLAALMEKSEKQQPMTLLEKDFLTDNSGTVDFRDEK